MGSQIWEEKKRLKESNVSTYDVMNNDVKILHRTFTDISRCN